MSAFLCRRQRVLFCQQNVEALVQGEGPGCVETNAHIPRRGASGPPGLLGDKSCCTSDALWNGKRGGMCKYFAHLGISHRNYCTAAIMCFVLHIATARGVILAELIFIWVYKIISYSKEGKIRIYLAGKSIFTSIKNIHIRKHVSKSKCQILARYSHMVFSMKQKTFLQL